MNDRPRLRREDPARTEPIRNWSTLYRRDDSWESPSPAGAGRGGSYGDVVTEGVELGYQVIEEQIRHGQRVAKQINKRVYNAGAMGNDVREVAERILRYSADLSALWFEFLVSMVGSTDVTDLLRTLFRQPTGKPEATAAPDSTGTAAVSIEIVSSRPVRVTLDLRPEARGRSLCAQDLRAPESGKPPLTQVTFEHAPGGGASTVRIRVPDTQPPGTYSGAVIDRDTGDPRGTLSVRLAGSPEAGIAPP